jgi:GNAT superfamily N-acetyltransferase
VEGKRVSELTGCPRSALATVRAVPPELLWRGDFASEEVDALHREAFDVASPRPDWRGIVDAHSVGWVTARDAEGLVGFVNVVSDGGIHAWLQDVMVAERVRRQGVGRELVDAAGRGATGAGCEWLHVDFEPDLADFYLEACGFEPTSAGLKRLPPA